MAFQNAYPPLPPVANPAATLSPKGLPIAVGAVIAPIHEERALSDELDHKRERDVSGTVTLAEVQQAKHRRIAIELEQVQATYPIAAPAWAVPLVGMVASLQQMIRNEHIVRNNSHLVALPPVVGPGAPVLGIRSKEVVGLMSAVAPLAFAALTPPGVFPAIIPVPAIGAVPPLLPGGIYPGTQAAILALTHQQILDLIEFYNEDFGIAVGDPIGVRINKVGRWIHL
eukprot:TRINITY_DN3811_c0_g1_i2.p1 TRINITY_DN3811_c0_g1~~TRINITY_DN3811_c0_g1_i2.p1  ORF type:complete len:227 (+),score=26.63 TRINITY_DN3811_c0_g1_i2:36-716(+)